MELTPKELGILKKGDEPMNNTLINKTGIKPWMLLLVGGVLFGSVATNRIDEFFNHNSLVFQTPVYAKPNPLISPQVIVKTVEVTATPVATSVPVLK